jgi:hypothetical protein
MRQKMNVEINEKKTEKVTENEIEYSLKINNKKQLQD